MPPPSIFEIDASPLSPELVLVDPELAARARARLPDPSESRLSQRAPSAAAPAVPAHRLVRFRQRYRANDVRALVGVAALVVVTLLFADVRVEVGKPGAAAEAPKTVRPSPQRAGPSRPPARPAATKARSRPPAKSRATKAPTRLRPSVKPKLRATMTPPRQLAWAPEPRAGSYHVELYRGSARVFSADTERPAVVVPERWKVAGRVRTLAPGTLRWYVWPVVDGRRATTAIVQATLTIPAP